MGVLVRWKVPDSESTWTQAEVHRSDDGGSTYTLKVTQSISDNTWYDEAGDTTNYYKVRFKTASSQTSDFSDPIQGGKINAYCSVEDMRTMTGLTTTDVADAELFTLLEFATGELNRDINVVIEDEEVEYISSEKSNKTDGSNTTFYTKKFPIGDLNDDGVVNTSDIEVYKLDTSSVRTTLIVSSVSDASIGKFVLSSAPASTDRVYIKRYVKAPLDEYTPHRMIRIACALNAAMWAFSRIEAKRIREFQLGKFSLRKQSDGFGHFEKKYQKIIDDINAGMVDTVEFDSTLQKLGALV